MHSADSLSHCLLCPQRFHGTCTIGQVGDFVSAEASAVKAMAHFDVLRGRGHGLWRDVGVLDLPRIMRYHHIAYEVLTEACKRLAYDRWLVEVRRVSPHVMCCVPLG